MRRLHSTALLSLACLLVFVSGARAGVTIDVVLQDAVRPSGMTIMPFDPGPGCTFSGYYGASVSSGYCMDVILTTTYDFVAMSVSVAYDSDSGLALAQVKEWRGIGVAFDKRGNRTAVCIPFDGIVDNGGILQTFDCAVTPPPSPPPMAPAGTYKIGTIVWDTSGLTNGTETIWAVIAGNHGFDAVINGNSVDISDQVVLRGDILTAIDEIPEPGTVSLMGLGFAGLVLAARRRRAAGL